MLSIHVTPKRVELIKDNKQLLTYAVKATYKERADFAFELAKGMSKQSQEVIRVFFEDK